MNPVFQGNAIFWVDVDKIRPNPYQPRREFEPTALQSLSDSIRQYGVLQPLVVTRYEVTREDGGLTVGYELVAGERRLRASKLAGIGQVPVIIRDGEESDRMKLELAIIENLQREDLNPIDRALAFERLTKEFGFTHIEIGRRVGKSRVYVTNTLRLLCLNDEMKQAVIDRRITEGHTRPLLMLGDREEEQRTLFKEMLTNQLNVRDAERIAREIAVDRARKKDERGSEIIALERELSDRLGTRVHIESRKEGGGKVLIEYFSAEDLATLRAAIGNAMHAALAGAAKPAQDNPSASKAGGVVAADAQSPSGPGFNAAEVEVVPESTVDTFITDITEPQSELELEDDPDMYAVRNFSV